MNQAELERHVGQWIERSAQPDPLMRGWEPCPFAKSVSLRGCVRCVVIPSIPVLTFMGGLISGYVAERSQDVVVCAHPGTPSVEELENDARFLNGEWMNHDVAVFPDHQDSNFSICGVKTGNRLYPLYIVQRLGELNRAAARLREAGYYKSWSIEALRHVLFWRFNPPSTLMDPVEDTVSL